eukprot:COSAG02_NODE_3645_length_6430_cov_55.318907_1_plen_984_part_00
MDATNTTLSRGPPPLDDAAQYWLATKDEVWTGYYVLIVAAIAMPILLLRRYSNPLANPLVIALCAGGWAISVVMVALCPIDLSGTFHQRCLRTQLEWAGQIELRANETYSWRLEPAEGGEYAEQQMYAALLPWSPEQSLVPDAFDAVQRHPYKTCTDEDVCPSWTPSPTEVLSKANNVLHPGTVYELQMSTAPDRSEFLVRVERSGRYALVTEHMPYKFISMSEEGEELPSPERLRQVLSQVLSVCVQSQQHRCVEHGRYVEFSSTPELNPNCMDTEQVHRHTMQKALRVCYWTLFFLGWFGVPFAQGILWSSEFTLRERAQYSLRFNGQYYFVYALVGISVVIALAIKLGSWNIYVVKAFGQAFSNTIGLFLCMLFLGYGLVEFPRNLWLQANYQVFLRQCEGRACSTKQGLDTRQKEYEDILTDLALFETLLQDVNAARDGMAHPMVAHDLHDKLQQVGVLSRRLEVVSDTVAAVVSDEDQGMQGQEAPTTPVKPSEVGSSSGGSAWSDLTSSVKKKIISTRDDKFKGIRDKFKSIRQDVVDLTDEDLLKAIVEIHGMVRERLVNLNKAKCKWTQLVDDALEMEDNIRNMDSRQQREWRFISDLRTELEYAWLEELHSRCMFVWRVFLKPPLLKVAALLGSFLSVAVLIGAASTMVYSLSLEYIGTGDAYHLSPVYFLISIPDGAVLRNLIRYICIVYYSFCCIYSLFKLKIPGFYELYVGATDEYTITLNTMLLMRIVPPMLWFFYGLVYEAAQMQTDTMKAWQERHPEQPPILGDNRLQGVTSEFAVVMSYINVVPFLGPHFLLYVPPILITWSWLTYQNSMSRLLKCLSTIRDLLCPCKRCKRVDQGTDWKTVTEELQQQEEAAGRSTEHGAGRRLFDAERLSRARARGHPGSLPGSKVGGGASSNPSAEQSKLLESPLNSSDLATGDRDSDDGDSSEELLERESRERKWHKRLEARRAEKNRTVSIERPLTSSAASP